MFKVATDQNYKLDIKFSTASAEIYVVSLSNAMHSSSLWW